MLKKRGLALSLPKGFSLIEALTVVAILAILMTIAIMSVNKRKDMADDAKKKTELELLKIAFEDYYGDNNCYPPAAWFDAASDCNSGNLKPYMNAIPCDKHTGKPYVLQTDATTCGWFRLTAQMKYPAVPSNCVGTGCTSQTSYVVSSGNIDPYPGTGGASENGALPAGHNYYWCTSLGNCSSFDPSTTSCTPYYTHNPDCNGAGAGKCTADLVGTCSTF